MNITRIIPSVLLATVVGFGLFMLMAALIDQEVVKPESDKKKIAYIHMVEKPITDQIEEQKPEKPPEQDAPPPDLPEPDFQDPDLDGGLSTGNVDTGLELGFDAGGLNISDGEYLPIVKIQPQYPRRAQSRGIEGYAIAEYTVTELGTTEGCVIIEAKTSKGKDTSVFNRNACKAAAKFKYQPRVVDGTAIKVPGVRNKFTFELQD